ncbi:MAG: putative Universal stress protein [Myxococcaceae bacterium]|nr:putative Universal stress protein [Myxococcaceae bacterium]
MIRRILVATDFSDSCAAAQVRAEELARLTHAELLLVHVRDEFPFLANDGSGFVPSEFVGQHAVAQAQVQRLAAEAVAGGLVARGVMVLGAPAQRILAVAEQEQVDLVVVGTNGRRGVQHFMLGSVAEQVARTSPVPVMVVAHDRERPAECRKTFLSPNHQGPAQTILVATDFEAASLAAVPYAFELAEAISARVYLLHVYAPVVLPSADGWGDVPFDSLHHRALVRVRELAKPYHRSEHLGKCIATMGEPSQVILETAVELAADMIVVGTHSRSGVKHLFLGSVAEHVIREATCPVVVARGMEQPGGHIALPEELEQARSRDGGQAAPVRS